VAEGDEMTVDEIILAVKVKGAGRTRHTGMEPFWDEVLVEEIERLRQAIREFLVWENGPVQDFTPVDYSYAMIAQTEKLAVLLPENQENINDQITHQTPDNQE
jgi:hypothetical protein